MRQLDFQGGELAAAVDKELAIEALADPVVARLSPLLPKAPKGFTAGLASTSRTSRSRRSDKMFAAMPGCGRGDR
jgi:hypothetical protein